MASPPFSASTATCWPLRRDRQRRGRAARALAVDMRAFIARLPEAEKTDLLCRSVLGNNPAVIAEIRHRWLATRAGSQKAEKDSAALDGPRPPGRGRGPCGRNGGICKRNGRQPSAPGEQNRKNRLERRLAALSGRETRHGARSRRSLRGSAGRVRSGRRRAEGPPHTRRA